MKTTSLATAAILLSAVAAACGPLDENDCDQPATVTVSLSSLGDAADSHDCNNDCIAYFAGAEACTYVMDGGIVDGWGLDGGALYSGDVVQCGDATPGNGGEIWPVGSNPTQSCNQACFQLDVDAGASFSGTCSFGWSFGTTVSCTYQPSCDQGYQGFT